MPFQMDASGTDRNAPVVTGGAGLGGSPPAPSIDPQSSDRYGVVRFGTGTVPVAGTILTVTFSRPKDANHVPAVMLQESSSSLAGVDLSVGSVTSTGFTIVQATRLVAASQPAGTYVLGYLVVD